MEDIKYQLVECRHISNLPTSVWHGTALLRRYAVITILSKFMVCKYLEWMTTTVEAEDAIAQPEISSFTTNLGH